MEKIVFFTGAGMSRESGLPTFRGNDGLWDSLDVEAVASRKSWYCGRNSNCTQSRQRMLDFFNPIRRMILEKAPNQGHHIIAKLEEQYKVTVITQNGDDYHTRAGSTNVIYLHGQALRNASTLHPYESFEIDRNNPDIRIGDKAPDGSQIRPYVIFFNEDIERRLWKSASEAAKQADIFVVTGSTMLVYPAADLLGIIPPHCRLYVIDPEETPLPPGCNREFTHIKAGATHGLHELVRILGER